MNVGPTPDSTAPAPSEEARRSIPVDDPRPTGMEPEMNDLALGQLAVRLIDQTSQPFVAIDLRRSITCWNQAFASLLGYEAGELRGMDIQGLTPPRWQATTTEALGQLHTTGRAQRYEKEYFRKDGSTVPVGLIMDFVRDDQDRPRGYYAFITDISERLQADQALRQSEDRFRRLYDEAPFGYHEIDTEGRIVSVNRTECEMLGYAPEEMVGRSIFDFVREDLRDESRRAVQERIRGERPVQSVERTYTTRDGRELILQIENRLTRDDLGNVVGIRSTMQDITKRKQTEAALVASERWARTLFEGINDAVFVHDLAGRILDINPAATHLLGYTREELLQLTTHDIDAPEFADGYEARLRQQLSSGRLSCEGQHRAKDGRTIPVEINTSTIRLENQTAILAVIRDITERKALEETRRQLAESQLKNARAIEAKNRELTRSESRYRRLAEGSLDAIVVADPEGRVTLFNPAAERTFGYSASEVFGRPLSRLIPDDQARDFQAALQARDPRVVGRTIELHGLRKGGEVFPLELSLSIVDLDGEPQFIGSIRDQTERQRMREMLVQSDRLASIGLLAAGVAHEINNPLAYIANNLAVLERDLAGVLEMMAAYESAREPLAQVAPECLARIQSLSDDLDWPYVRENLNRMFSRTRDGVQRVANIVQKMRGMARTSPTKMEPALLRDLVEGAAEMVQGRVRQHDIELVMEIEDLPKITCTPAEMGQVVLNLVVNAIQAVEEARPPQGGRVVVRLRAEPGCQIIEIIDNGVGIPPEIRPHLFDPFYTTKPVGEGTGLGLSISHGIVTGHGGRIEVESAAGQGTCFRIRLPTDGPPTEPQGR